MDVLARRVLLADDDGGGRARVRHGAPPRLSGGRLRIDVEERAT
jgi:hypothetical protein